LEAVDERGLRPEFWKMSRSRLIRLAGRMQRVGEQQQRFDEIGLVGRQHARPAAAVKTGRREKSCGRA
jgi:hypothetical protein